MRIILLRYGVNKAKVALDRNEIQGVNRFLGTGVGEEDFFFESDRFLIGGIKPGVGTIVVPEPDSPVIQSVFSFASGGEIRIKSEGGRQIVRNGEHNLVSLSDPGAISVSAAGENQGTFYITFYKNALNQLLREGFSCLFRFVEGGRPMEVLAGQNMCITPEMTSIINEVVRCKRVGPLRKLFIEAKVLKLLMLQLEQFEVRERKLQFIKEYDVEKIHQAKLIVDTDISSSVSLIELAHMVGLNDFKLKKGFKEIYGTTVYNYLYELRMQEAKKRLLNSSQPVNQIASCCGYEFVQSFIKAFKRKYGVSPEGFRNAGFG